MRTTLPALLCALFAMQALAQGDETPKGNDEGWAYYAELTGSFVPYDDDYATPVIMADRDWLHLEARYNYEDLNTTSLWAGYNFKSKDGESLIVTPMIGGVFGDTRGAVAGVEVIGKWKRIDFYTEGEHLFSSDDESEDYTYFWTELTYSTSDWFRAGVVSQRTKVIESDTDVLRGLLVVLTFDKVYVWTSLFEPGSDDQVFVATVGTEF